ncbi:calcium ion binding protein [Trifolium pratense]|uniref:Calcium ion binding protein n=2 Tax=Trifolium pratense TaxID=57577 RepID=A0A2K3MRT0_TRIPR|nr:uncharacterized protein LOC123890547 [Trifolium pratense]PNX93466.1 calcium ion binding protein [Trifolium pratense]CAJ2631493.1 unnamed protein product [Trifolium pratense]
MSDGSSFQLQILDGTNLRDLDLSLIVFDRPVTGAQILHIAHSQASPSFFDLPFPDPLKTAALNRLNTNSDAEPFLSTETEYQPIKASQILKLYIAAIADELKANPLVLSILDGSTLRLFFEDEDDFAMLAENLFTDLDVEDKGKISKSQIRNALVQMGVDMGVPPFSEYPQLNDLLSKHGVDGEEELGQAQFAQLLQSVLQDLEVELSKKNFVFIQNVQVINGSKIRQLLANEKELNSFVEKATQEKPNAKGGLGSTEIIRSFLERNTKELGLPLSESSDAAVLFYDSVFADVAKEKDGVELEKEGLAKLLKDILEKMAEQLELNPVYQEFA